MQGGRVIPLDKVQDRDTASVGAKAHALARLMRLGLPVPFGFCITGAAYRERVISGDLAARIGDAVGRPVDGSPPSLPEERPDGLTELREAIAGAPITGALREEIEAAWRALAADRVAVRSSATAEDLPESSFAGRYESHLGIAALEDCLAAIKNCWASLWTERAFDYRAREGIDHLTVDMAVIVQELVPAEASGVLFTADPVSGARDRLVIEGGFGLRRAQSSRLGVAVASGKVSPDRVVVLKEELRVIERTISEKTVEIVPDERGGVRERPVPAGPSRTGRAERSAIEDVTALRLAVLGVRAEREFGCPLDLEWAVCSGDVSILQCRPITALPADPKSRRGGIVRRLTGLLRRDTAEAPARAEADRPRAREKGPTGTAATAESVVATEESAPAAKAVSPAEIEKTATPEPPKPPEPPELPKPKGKSSAETEKEDRQVWTRANAAEVLPDVMTPMTASVMEGMVGKLLGSFLHKLGLGLEGHPFVGVVAGRAYFNLNTAIACVRRIPGMGDESITRFFGGSQKAAAVPGEIETAEEDVPDLRFSALAAVSRLPGFIIEFLSFSPSKGNRVLAQMRRKTDGLEGTDLPSLSDEELAGRVTAAFDDLLGSDEVWELTGVVQTYETVFYDKCREWFGPSRASGSFSESNDESGEALASRLLAGLGGNENARAGLELWRLAALAHERPAVEAALLDANRFADLRDSIRGARGGDEFLAAWDAFMRDDGHHCRGELEFMNPRWSERPERILEQVKSCVRAIGGDDFLARYERLAGARASATRECRRRLRNPFRRLAFDFMLHQAQRCAPIRESLKSRFVRWLAGVRRLLLELGKSLVWRRVLAERDDVFFLTLEELAPALGDPPGFDVRDLVAKRRAEYERNLSITPPSVVVGRLEADNFVPDEVDPTLTEFTGVAVCPGVVRGPARVILQSGTEQVLPGEILVAPSTDPGWAPYFLNAAAIVVDVGGILSHGSIIAREYGIPTVVNVGPATKVIKTGQMLRVDGGRGEVRILG